jgi:RNA polymerase sigma factor (sigma-70 family)
MQTKNRVKFTPVTKIKMQPKPEMENQTVSDDAIQHLSDKAVKDYRLVLKAMNEGDQKAYAELMSRYKDSIYYMLLKMVNNRDDAEDLTIEAFGKAFRNIKQYTPDYAFSTWLFKIATNNCIDFIRRKRKMLMAVDRGIEHEDGQEVTFEVKAEGPGPDDFLMKKQRRDTMKEVVDKLKPRYRKLVELRYYQELSYEEIAMELNLPLGTVKAQLFRAREFLYQIMKNTEYVMH